MKKFLLTVAVFALTAGPAFAQFYPGSRPPPPPQPQYQQPHHDRGYNRNDYRRGPQRPQARVCVTSRGSCPAPFRAAPGMNCRCDLPGFGMKRGNVR